jgi:hypothetical protein
MKKQIHVSLSALRVDYTASAVWTLDVPKTVSSNNMRFRCATKYVDYITLDASNRTFWELSLDAN